VTPLAFHWISIGANCGEASADRTIASTPHRPHPNLANRASKSENCQHGQIERLTFLAVLDHPQFARFHNNLSGKTTFGSTQD